MAAAAVPMFVLYLAPPATATLASFAIRTATLMVGLVLSVTAALRADPAMARARWWLTASIALGTTASALSTLSVAGRGHAVIGSPADVVALSSFAVAGFGLYFIPRPDGEAVGQPRLLLDGVIAGSALLFCAWLFVIAPTLRAHVHGLTTALDVVGYPLGDAMVGALVLAVAPHARRDARPLLGWAAAGIFLLGIGDSAHARMWVSNRTTSFGWPDVLVEAGVILLAWAAVAKPPAGQHCTGRSRLDLPLVAAACTVVFGFPYVAVGHRLGVVEVAPAAVMIMTLLTRQRLYARELMAVAAAHEYAAAVDDLTGVATRRMFLTRLDEHLRADGVTPVAVALIDLDGFKEINDRYGHHAGDEVLIHFSRLLRRCARDHLVARLGGDEFAVACVGADAAAEVRTIADAIGTVHRVSTAGEGGLAVGCSIGLAVSAAGDRRTADLLRRADLAMYAAKAAPAVRVVMFEQKLQDAASRKNLLVADLVGVAARGELHLVFQPIHRLEDGAVVAAEALLRWQHPTFGAVSPMEFIPLAEETGQIGAVGAWVLDEALRTFARLRREGASLPRLLVNVSTQQFDDPSFPAHVAQLLDAHQVPPSCLTLEITETQLSGLDATEILNTLQAIGLRLAIDDFGTGYSNLARLSQLPVEMLKIDREFINRLERPAGRDVLDAVVALAATLGMTTVAEGIETEHQRVVARECGIAWGQGYLLGRPAPAADLQDQLARLPPIVPLPRISADAATSLVGQTPKVERG
jgi:diguanylate cyclase (GGDEF)-like protein